MKCNVCGREVTYKDKDGKDVHQGITFNFTEDSECDEFAKDIENEFGKRKFNVCFSCWLKSLGIKPEGLWRSPCANIMADEYRK